MKNYIWIVTVFILTAISCQESNDREVLASFDIYCEMVANGAKPVALHYPMLPKEVDRLWDEFTRVADKRGVSLYREDSFPVSYLFPASATDDKSVVLIYKGYRLNQYLQWKADLSTSSDELNTQLALARRFGRLLGYDHRGINDLMTKNSPFRDVYSAYVVNQTTHLYYKDVERALEFYENNLGLQRKDSLTFAIGNDAYIKINALNEDHPDNEVKSTAIALLTNQLSQWYDHIQAQEIPIKYTYKPKEGGPHDGFVAIDPEGYLLEFEEFKQHPENELFIAVLDDAPRVITNVDSLAFFGSITWTYHKDLLKVQKFYQNELGFQLVADQGWTKIFQTSPTGFIGLVDERRGMENYSDVKAVEIEWGVISVEELSRYAVENNTLLNLENRQILGPERYRYNLSEVEKLL